MDLRAGTSGFAYKEWKGSFYPDDLADAAMLGYYAERLAAVEINNTFYRMPKVELLEGWAAKVPEDFSFVLKASRRITHKARLADVEDPLGYLLETTSVLGDRLGAHLFQLPPWFKADVDRLRTFLQLLPPEHRAALEFRHPSWFEDEVYAVLADAGAALCVADAAKLEVPRVATSDWGYLRLRRDEYDDASLREWAMWVGEQDWDEAFVFFKHEDRGAGPRLAARFQEIFEEVGSAAP